MATTCRHDNESCSRGVSQVRDEREAAELEGKQNDVATELGEVVLVGAGDLLDQTVRAQALEEARDLAWGQSEELLQASILETAELELTTGDGLEQLEVAAGEEVEASPGATVVVHGLADAVEIPHSAGGIVESR